MPTEPFTAGAPPYVIVMAAIVANYLVDETAPDVHTVAVLEDAIQCELWPAWATRG